MSASGATENSDASSSPGHGPVADAAAGNWVDRFAPPATRPYLRLMRADRPIGTWLLLFPCWWSASLAAIGSDARLPDLWHLMLFAVGAFVMRGAGCAYNDYVDRDYDAQVARTRSRPIPSGQVAPWQALALVAVLGLIGLAVLVQFNAFTIGLGVGSLALVLIYPFMKRVTYWPQVVLGLAFNWGALVGWSAATGGLALAPALLYAGAVAWTIGYDTIYAHQDKEDDLMAGLKSTAIRFGEATHAWVGGLYAAAVGLWLAAALAAGGGWASIVALAAVAAHFAWQVGTLDTGDADVCLVRFRANRQVGWLVLAGFIAEAALAG
ncbi:MAG: 4-hydroxybenzoate octaprenyltransferase [Hyphomicrobiaceae bacterium]|nr:4-hydroxybenzoate octaprenyltransferase [Hyphomicrobiaceae bacterium]